MRLERDDCLDGAREDERLGGELERAVRFGLLGLGKFFAIFLMSSIRLVISFCCVGDGFRIAGRFVVR